MKVFRPIKTNSKSQEFGEDKACKHLVTGKIIGTHISGVCPDGYTSLYRSLGMKGHSGEDLRAWHGEPLYFPVEATTRWWMDSRTDRHGGIEVNVYSQDRVFIDKLPKGTGRLAKADWEKNGKKSYIKFKFTHLKAPVMPTTKTVETGTFSDGRIQYKPEVRFGQLIGYCDNTGLSSGDHLHWSMKFCAKNSMVLDGDNGYMGAVDFSTWYENTFVLDILNVVQKALDAIDQANKVIFQVRKFLGLLKR